MHQQQKPNKRYERVFAIIRFDTYYDIDTPIEIKIHTTKVFWTEKDAEWEIKRLNSLKCTKGSIYFYQPICLVKEKREYAKIS